MRSNSWTYENVAKNCDSYSPEYGCRNKTTNSASSNCRSCMNCCHFDKCGEYCELDLYDKIVEEMNP